MYRFDISGKELLDARKILLEGEMAVADNPVLHRRMQLALLPVNLALLQQPLLWEPLAPELAGIQWRPLMEEQLALIKDAKVVRLAEAPFTPDMLQHKIEMLLSWEKGAPPVPGYAAGTKWKQIAAVDCLRFKPYEFVDDPDALTGKAVEVECTHKTWTSQLWRPVTGTWDVYVDLQCTGDNPSGKTATFGFYDLEEKKNIQSGSVDAKDIAAPGYHLVKMGRLVSTGDQYLYCAPTINNSVKKLRISRYVFIKAE